MADEIKTPRPRKTPVPVAVLQEAGVQEAGVRDWKDVAKRIRELKGEGQVVPQIAETLQLSYVLVNQVMLQSYKMTVDTVALFERQEQQRVAGQQQQQA